MKTNDYIAAKLSTLLLLLLAYCFCAPQQACAQEENNIKVTVKLYTTDKDGKIVPQDDKEGFAMFMEQVKIINLRTKVEYNPNEDGAKFISVKPKDKVKIELLGYKSVVATIGKDTREIEARLVSMDQMLNEAVVNSEAPEEGRAAPSIPKPRGNYLYYSYELRVKRKHFGRDGRVITQPVLYNHDKDTMLYLRPKVFERPEYNISQDRLYGFDVEENDPLGEYIALTVKGDSLNKYGTLERSGATKEEQEALKNLSKFKKFFKRIKNAKNRLKKRKKDEMFLRWQDSVYIENPRDFVSTTLRYKTEDYMEVKWDSSQIVSVGTCYPLRWLQYDAGLAEIDKNDKRVPTIDSKAIDESDKADLFFPNGKYYFDPENEHNKQELAKLEERIRLYLGNKGYYNLQSITMKCTSSPEGNYKSNADLAFKRSNFALGEVRKMLGPDKDYIEQIPEYDVAPWTDVAELLRKDSLFEQADAIERIAKSSPNDLDAQGKEIRNLDKVFPNFYELLKQKYLPQLRRMDYAIKYNIVRKPTLEESREEYAKNKARGNITPEYMYWQLYTNAQNDSIRESILREALDVHKKSSFARLFAHDLQVCLVRQHKPDTTLLVPYVDIHNKRWVEINLAHAVALLQTGHFQSAANLMVNIPLTRKTEFLKSVCEALYVTDSNSPIYDEIAKSSQCNKVVVLLHCDKDIEAYNEVQQMPDSLAMKHYLLATCICRLGRAGQEGFEQYKNKAKQHLKKAFELDPELEIIFEKDADVNNVFYEGQEDVATEQLYEKMLPRHKRLEEKDSKRPRTQNFLEYEGKPYGSKWKGYHVIDKPE